MGIGGAILLGEKWHVLDPLAAVVVSIFIVKVSLQLVIPSINELLEKSLPSSIEDEIIRIITESPEVKDPHNLRTRQIGNNIAIGLRLYNTVLKPKKIQLFDTILRSTES